MCWWEIPIIRKYPDAKFKKCRKCNHKWNVSALDETPEELYLCPICSSGRKNRVRIIDGVARDAFH